MSPVVTLADRAPAMDSVKSYQQQFADFLRQKGSAPSGCDPRRMALYRRLVIGSYEGFAVSCFPVTRKILTKDEWQQLIERSFADSLASSPLFRDIPELVLNWMDEHRELFAQYPWLYDLMHYEWLELVVETDPAKLDESWSGDLSYELKGDRLLLNPTLQLGCYHWPVQHIAPGNLPGKPLEQPCCIALFRDSLDRINFVSLSLLAAQLLTLLAENVNLSDALTRLAIMATGYSHEQLNENAGALLSSLQEQGIIRAA